MIGAAWEFVTTWFERAYEEWGLLIPSLVFVIGYMAVRHFNYVEKNAEKRIEAKQEEIERLVSERNWLQERLFPDRLSSAKSDEKETEND